MAPHIGRCHEHETGSLGVASKVRIEQEPFSAFNPEVDADPSVPALLMTAVQMSL